MSNDSDETRVFQASESPPADALVGTVLAGRYRIEKLLGVGAMGAVYLGQHLKIGRRDAIKVLHSSMARDPDAIARFDRGARNVGAIRHPNVCTIYDFSDTDDGLQYLAMEFVAGEALKDLLDREGVLPLQRSLRIIDQVASALQAAHDAGVVHRDLKPANIMIAPGKGGADAVKVVDFDISKGSGDVVEEEVTRLGFVVGTPEYMSPEQLFGGALDGRSDVYSTALMLYRMLTGGLPFRGETMQETMSARLKDEPLLRLEEVALGSTFPAELQATLDRALKCKLDERTASAAEFAAELRAVAATLAGGAASNEAMPATRVVTAHAAGGPLAAAPSFMRRRRPLAVAIGVVALVGMSGFAANQAGLFGGTLEDSTLPADSLDAGGQITLQPDADSLEQSVAGADDDGAPAPEQPPSRGTAGRTTTRVQTTPEASDGPVTSAAAPTSQPVDAGIAPDRVGSILNRQQDLLADGTPPNAVLVAMRDTARTIYDMTAVPAAQRAKAAWITANVALHFGDVNECTRWAGRATTLAPTNGAYASMADICRSAG